jgi:hypothetical protein
MGVRAFEVVGRAVIDRFCGRGMVSASGAVWGEFVDRESGKTNVNRTK